MGNSAVLESPAAQIVLPIQDKWPAVWLPVRRNPQHSSGFPRHAVSLRIVDMTVSGWRDFRGTKSETTVMRRCNAHALSRRSRFGPVSNLGRCLQSDKKAWAVPHSIFRSRSVRLYLASLRAARPSRREDGVSAHSRNDPPAVAVARSRPPRRASYARLCPHRCRRRLSAFAHCTLERRRLRVISGGRAIGPAEARCTVAHFAHVLPVAVPEAKPPLLLAAEEDPIPA